jgi:IS4 transposase
MIMHEVVQRFVEDRPVTAMVRAGLEYALKPDDIDRMYVMEGKGYFRKQLFSQVVNLMSLVVGKVHPRIHTAYQQVKDDLEVSLDSVYEKLKRVHPETSAALVRHVYARLSEVVDELGAMKPPLFPGYPTRIVDGKHIDPSQRRIEAIRRENAKPLPAQLLVTLDRERGLVCDVVCCEDAHVQERSLFDRLLPQVNRGELWIEDRNFCTTKFVFGVASRDAFFIARRHQSTLHVQHESQLSNKGRIETGVVSEGTMRVSDGEGQTLSLRRVVIELEKPTRNADKRIELLTNLPEEIDAKEIAEGYRQRWMIETVFGRLSSFLHAEMETLGYPKAALFAFCVALVAYNLLQLVRTSIAAEYGTDVVEQQVSSYFLANEVRRASDGLEVLISKTSSDQNLQTLTAPQLAEYLIHMVHHMRLDKYPKSSRGPKKPPPRKFGGSRHRHVATYRKLQRSKTSR